MQDLDDEWHDSGIHDGLNLVDIACRDVGDSPGTLLLDIGLGMTQQVVEHRQNIVVNDTLGLSVVTSHDVAHSTQGWRDDADFVAAE